MNAMESNPKLVIKVHSTHSLRVLGVVFSQVDLDLVELGLVHAVGSGRHVPVVQQDPAALVAGYPDVDLEVKGWR